jgi:hypothetical protein
MDNGSRVELFVTETGFCLSLANIFQLPQVRLPEKEQMIGCQN